MNTPNTSELQRDLQLALEASSRQLPVEAIVACRAAPSELRRRPACTPRGASPWS